MRLFRFLLSIATAAFLIWLLALPHSVGQQSLPALGNFLNPFTGFWQNAEPAAPQSEDLNTALPGLKDKVEVVYDDLLVPHIFAQNLEDAMMVQGYLTARYRLWQIDISSRQTSGRLAEILGPRLLEIDRLTRRRGIAMAAKRDWDSWKQSPVSAARIEAFTAGVNAYITRLTPAEYPIEFKLLNYKPELWTPLKTALVVESMIDALNGYDEDLAATNSLAVLGRETFDYLFPQWNPKQQPVVPDTGQWANIHPDLGFVPHRNDGLSSVPGTEVPERRLSSDFRDLNGSNNWAVSGKRTVSGYPILSDDMHLPLRLPHTWMQWQIHTPEQNCYGVNVPGVPGIAVGFNEDIAWGFTNVSQDVGDWYRIKWADEKRLAYVLDGQTIPVKLVVEDIRVKGQSAPVRDSVRYTLWGPIVYDFDPKHPLHDCAYRFTTHDAPTPPSVGEFLNLPAGKNYDDYRKAIPGVDCLSQNIAFVSHTGDVAITVQGKLPVRAREQGRFIQDGSERSSDWHGFIPEEQLPAMKNPSRGYVFSANQHSTPPSYPYYYLGNFEDFRSREIHDRLENMSRITIDSMKSMQLDNRSMKAADALPAMLRLLDTKQLDRAEIKMMADLTSWNAQYERNLTAPSLFEMWFDSTYTLTWDEMDVYRKNKTDVLYPEAWRFIELLEKDTASAFFDHPATPQRETAKDIVTEGFHRMSARTKALKQEELAWWKFKGFAIKHIAQLDAFSRLDVPTDGIRNAPNAIGKTHGPSWRMIVEMTRPVHAVGVYPGGQSGNPGSRYYDNMLDAWAKGNYYELLLLHNPEEIPAERKLRKEQFSH